MTATAADLQIEFRALRDTWRETGEGQYAVARAYNAWFHQSCLEGDPPDALNPRKGSDVERFFARTIPGTDGHTYWTLSLSSRFTLNEGGERNPRWWWYEHIHGPQERGRLGSVCGEINCITPDHQQYAPWSEVKRRYTDEQMIGALQVAAQRLGRPPTLNAYGDLKLKPHRQVIALRFGSWPNALRAAGLEPSIAASRSVASEEDCIASLVFVAGLIGHAPTEDEFRVYNDELRAAGLHSSVSTIYRCTKSWPKALKLAGLTRKPRGATREATQTTKGTEI